MPEIYTAGYGRLRLPQLVALVEAHDATLFDIRWSPKSKNPAFTRGNLHGALKGRYRHVQEFGNPNYRGGPIVIANYAKGRELVAAAETPVVLLCACASPAGCHRTVVAEMLRADGFAVSELDPSLLAPDQGTFW